MTIDDFYQEFPELPNQYEDDRLLKAYIKRVMPRSAFHEIDTDLRNMGERVVGDILHWGNDAEENPPVLLNFDAWGRRIDEVKTARGWEALHAVAAQEGLVALGYERKFEEFSRVYQFAKLYLYTPSSACYSCPLAMTDGAARLIELTEDPELMQKAYRHLTSRDTETFWTSGQWMTEKRGGSDVSQTATRARHMGGDNYCLYGLKWFTSATTSSMAMTLARITDKDGNTVPGSKGLSLFYLETRLPDGELNGIKIDRLKDKLGTRALPTAELSLDGCMARRIGPEGQGVRLISTLFNITRIYNAMTCASYMRRTLAIARSYADKRMAFGRKLSDLPLHAETLAQMEIRFRASFAATFSTIEILGRVETGKGDEDDAVLLRLLTPVIKLFTAKEAMLHVTEFMECMGGAAYIENTGLSKWLRDTQVLAIWEGTTNVLSLDMLRAFEKEKAFPVFLRKVRSILKEHAHRAAWAAYIEESLKVLEIFHQHTSSSGIAEASARDLALSVGRIWAAVCLMQHAEQTAGDDPLAEATLEAFLRKGVLCMDPQEAYAERISLARG